jgi:hypothetical protein
MSMGLNLQVELLYLSYTFVTVSFERSHCWKILQLHAGTRNLLENAKYIHASN